MSRTRYPHDHVLSPINPILCVLTEKGFMMNMKGLLLSFEVEKFHQFGLVGLSLLGFEFHWSSAYENPWRWSLMQTIFPRLFVWKKYA